ncbi:zinc finger, CCHC-type containing protein [Tanacetum coccineum]|uniref:Zinc finger, CCHC-type containing protein n=1 Tax=Tanacetum coccineum TaxID=301880 RepID=A0ABQ4YY07_9ASTR
MGDENPILTLEDYSKPSYEGYRNTIELPVGNNVVPLRPDTIRLVQNGCSFHGLRSQDPNQHLKDFLKLVDSLDLDGSITTWEDLTTRFLAQFFPPRRIAKLCNDILMFQQHHGESLSKAWTCFKDLLQKVLNHGIDLWLQFSKYPVLTDQQIRRIHQLDTTYRPFHSEQRIDFYSLNGLSVLPNNTAYLPSADNTAYLVVGPIRINGVSQDRFRLSTFPISLAGAAVEWFKKDCIGSVTTWDDLVEKFVQKFYQLSYNNEEIKEDDDPDDITDIFKC